MISGCSACRSLLGSLRTEERLVTRSQSVPFCCASSASLPQPPCLHLDAVAWSILCRGHVKGLIILLSGYLAGCGGKHCRGNVSGRVFRLGQGIALPRVPSPPIPSRTEWTFLFVSVVFWGLQRDSFISVPFRAGQSGATVVGEEAKVLEHVTGIRR